MEKLKKHLHEECGCKMALPSGPCSGTRFKRWHCRCSCHMLQKAQDGSKFDEGCNSLKGCKKESVKRQNNKSRATEGMSKQSDAATKGKEVAGEFTFQTTLPKRLSERHCPNWHHGIVPLSPNDTVPIRFLAWHSPVSFSNFLVVSSCCEQTCLPQKDSLWKSQIQ